MPRLPPIELRQAHQCQSTRYPIGALRFRIKAGLYTKGIQINRNLNQTAAIAPMRSDKPELPVAVWNLPYTGLLFRPATNAPRATPDASA